MSENLAGDLARVDREGAGLGRALETEPSEVRRAAARALRRLDRPEASISLREAFRRRPSSAPLAALLGASLHAQGRSLEGAGWLDRAVALEPSQAWPYAVRAEILSDRGYVLEAIVDIEKALRFSGNDPALCGRKADYYLQRRDYDEAEAWLERVLRLHPREAGLRAKRALLFSLTDRLPEALGDLEKALELAPDRWDFRLARLRLLLQSGRGAAVDAEIKGLEASPDPRLALEGAFYRGCLDWRRRRRGLGARHFQRVVAALPRGDPLSLRARFYWLAARALASGWGRRRVMKRPAKGHPRLYLCGLGIFPPYTASLEVLHALSRCDVLFNNVAGEEVRQLLTEICRDVRPASYQAWQDEPRWADRIFAELRRGRAVGFVTRGHPLVFGGLARELVRRCAQQGVALESFGAVSSIDHLLAYLGRSLGDDFRGIQAFDRPAVEQAAALNTREPLLVCFYGGLEGAAEVSRFKVSLQRFYPPGHECWMFGPKYDDPPRVLRLAELPERFPSIHSSLMLYLAPAATEGRG